MKIFVDTGDVSEVRKAAEWGILDGVTTNPTLIAKSGRGFKETVLELCDILPNGDISAEVVAVEYDEMVREAEEIASWHPNIVVKVPLIEPGIRLVKHLSDNGIRTNVTLVFTVGQALLAAKAGATYISNFVGRVDDLSLEGMDAVRDSVQMVETYGFASEILVASVRHPLHVLESIRAGAHVATMPYKTIAQLFGHPLTTSGLERFSADWVAAGLSIFPPQAANAAAGNAGN